MTLREASATSALTSVSRAVEAALEPTREAIRLDRQLASNNPAAHNDKLGRSLSNLGGDLLSLGLDEEALQPLQEGLDFAAVCGR